MSSTCFFDSANEIATLTNTFTVSGTPTDPTTVSLVVTSPSGVATTYTYAGGDITKTSTGVYTKNIQCSEAGDWIAAWTGTTAAADVVEIRWTVFASNANLYCSVESLKSRFGITDTNDDFELQRAVRAASRRIESYCGRERFWCDPAPIDQVYEACGPYCVKVPEGISTATGLVVKTDLDGDGTFETTLTITRDFQLKPYNTLLRSPPWPYDTIEIVGTSGAYFPSLYGRPGVQITARFGWPVVPDDVAEAALILAHRLFKRKETASGVVGVDGMGATVRLARTDPDVAELLSPYVVLGVG